MNKLSELLGARGWLLADGATGTNYFQMGLQAGEPPETWNETQPDKVRALHRAFIEAGSDIILTNTFGGNRRRLMLHGAQDQARAINASAARHARVEADAAGRPVLVAGSMGPSGDLIEPLGSISRVEIRDAFAEQAEGLAEGGADLLWIETLSAEEEVSAAVEGASATGLPIIVTLSFDTGGRTMMGMKPGQWPAIANALPTSLAGFGANCGVGPAELLATILGISETAPAGAIMVAKGNCGIPVFVDGVIAYNGTPEMMADYARFAVDLGARIIGGCCGTSPEHVAAMHAALDGYVQAERPTVESIERRFGDVSRLAHGIDAQADAVRKRSRRPSSRPS